MISANKQAGFNGEMKTITIHNKIFQLHMDYQHDENRRREFNRLTQAFWKFDFENYYQSGYWDETCLLYSIFDEDRMVSHATVSLFQSVLAGQPATLLQLGTVMTDKDYQQTGLSRFLMEYIMETFRDRVDGMFLFANDTVLDFYPKFGFTAVKEYQAFRHVTSAKTEGISKRKLNLDNTADLQLMEKFAKNGLQSAALEIRNAGLLFFYCYAYPKYGFKDSIYFIESLQTLVIAQSEGEELTIVEVFSETPVSTAAILSAFADEPVKTVALGFSPEEKGFEYREYKEEDLTLFVSPALLPLFRKNKWMVPVLSHT